MPTLTDADIAEGAVSDLIRRLPTLAVTDLLALEAEIEVLLDRSPLQPSDVTAFVAPYQAEA